VALLTAGVVRSAPYYVDLKPLANTSREDDGIARNGQGGWTDEGINDMFLYPPLPVGPVERNGYRFSLLDPTPSNACVALMLRVGAHDTGRPKSAQVSLPDVKGRFVYFVQNGIGGSQARPDDTVAIYTVHYADGQSVEIPMQKGKHLRDWWCKNWWDNSGADAWPVHMGVNVYSLKWKCLIGLWATQWRNPRPDAPIRGIAFAALDKGAPVLWAVTVDDDDYRANDAANKGNVWQRVPPPPEGYFERKLACERGAIYAAAVDAGFVEGVRTVELVRADLLAVTVDPALTRVAAGPCNAAAAAAQRSETFTVTSTNDTAFAKGVHPAQVGRDSYEYWNGDIGSFKQNSIYWHTYYLRLPQALRSGCDYTVRVAGIAAPLRAEMALHYDDATTPTPVIKVNQVAYSARARRRYAYLGWWAGDLGAVDYGASNRYEVVDEQSDRVALQGAATARPDPPGNSGENVLQIDLAALPPGRFHVRVPGLGRSAAFGVGGEGLAALYRATQRAFYHQRCGFPLSKPFTPFEKPACHLWVYESGKMADDTRYKPAPNEAKREYRGGYHDAADFDCFTYHLRAAAQSLDAFDMTPAAFRDGDLNLPESGNKIPDVLDEAQWALRFYLDQQAPDGGVPKGRCNDQDSRRQDQGQWGPFGIFKPEQVSNLEYAAVAASFAWVFRQYDADLAARYQESAVKAFDWAMAQPAGKDESLPGFTLWAAGALYRATGAARFNDLVRERVARDGFKVHWKIAVFGPLMRWPYVRCEQPGTDEALRAKLRQEILRLADGQLKDRLDKEAYRWGGDSTRALGWGNGNGGGHYADVLLRAWWLTGEQRYLDGASLNADFQLGCNPLSKTFITGMGARPPLHPQISAFLYEQPGKRGGTVAGITIYGLSSGAPADWYPADRPKLRRWRDLGNGGAEVNSEFTVTETLGASAMLYSALCAAEAAPASAEQQ
jgi:endoglucanase